MCAAARMHLPLYTCLQEKEEPLCAVDDCAWGSFICRKLCPGKMKNASGDSDVDSCTGSASWQKIYKKRLKNTCIGYIMAIEKKNTPQGFADLKEIRQERNRSMQENKKADINIEERTEKLEKDGVCPGCVHKTKERSEKERRDMMNRLSRIEGQVRGIKRMVENDAYCPDILIQVSAVNAALNSFNKVLLANHIKTCVTEDIKKGKEETIDELVLILQKLMK